MEHGHWIPPNRGATNLVTNLDYGMGAGAHSGSASAVPVTNGTSRPRGDSKSGDLTSGGNAHRSQRLTSAAERYGPAGVVQVARHYHGPGCPDCSGSRSVHTVRSAFGPQDRFRQGG